MVRPPTALNGGVVKGMNENEFFHAGNDGATAWIMLARL